MEYFNCRECDKEFESYSKLDGSSKLLGKYVKYLGYCSEKCFNKLDGGEKNEDLMFAALGGLTAETTADGTVTHGLDVNGLTAAVIASGDFLAFSDEGTSGDPTKKESIDDIATLFAGTGLTAASAVISVDAAQTAATSSMTSSTSRTITTPLLSVESGTSSKPVIQIKNTHDGTTGAELKFVSNDASAGADGDDIGTISFYADDSGGNQTAFASILAEV